MNAATVAAVKALAWARKHLEQRPPRLAAAEGKLAEAAKHLTAEDKDEARLLGLEIEDIRTRHGLLEGHLSRDAADVRARIDRLVGRLSRAAQ